MTPKDLARIKFLKSIVTPRPWTDGELCNMLSRQSGVDNASIDNRPKQHRELVLLVMNNLDHLLQGR